MNTIKSNWTFDADVDLTEVGKEFSKILQEEIDWEVMVDILTEIGWTKIELPNKFLPVSGIELHKWREQNLTGNWKAHGGTWLFEKEKDAVVFALRWT